MHSLSNRANTIICFGGMVLFGVLLLNIASRAFFPDHINVDLKLNQVARFNRKGPIEFAQVFVDLKTDLTPLFNWNTKMLFIYITAEYSTKENPISQVVLYDRIITDKEKADIDDRGLIKYYLVDQGLGLT
eukprot:gene3669-4569_t